MRGGRKEKDRWVFIKIDGVNYKIQGSVINQ